MKGRITHSRASITSFLLSQHLEFPVFLSNSRTNSLNEGRSTELLLRKRRTVPFSTTPFHWRAGGGGRRGAPNQNQNAPKCMSFQLYATRRKKKRAANAKSLLANGNPGLALGGRAAPATTVQNGTEGLTPAHPSSRTLHEAPEPLPTQGAALLSPPGFPTPAAAARLTPSPPQRSPQLPHQKMFGLGSPLAAPSLTELARVKSQEREKETQRVGGSFGRGGAGTRARLPRPRWLQREGRRGRTGETRNAANPAGAALWRPRRAGWTRREAKPP